MKNLSFYSAISFIIALLCLAGCTNPNKADTSADVKRISQLTDFYTDAINQNLGDSLVKVYFGSQYYDLNEGNQPLTKDQMRKYFSGLSQRSKQHTGIVADSIAVDGSLGTVRGHFPYTWQKAGSDTVTVRNFNYMEVWHKVNGEWKVWWGMVSLASQKDSVAKKAIK